MGISMGTIPPSYMTTKLDSIKLYEKPTPQISQKNFMSFHTGEIKVSRDYSSIFFFFFPYCEI